MAWCLPKHLTQSFKDALVKRRLDPAHLAEMSSAERHTLFEKELGVENAEPINAAFESKLLLKNRQQAYITWAKQTLGEKTPAGRDVISRVQRMDKILSPTEEKAFLADLAAKRLGTSVSYGEAKQIAELSKGLDEAKARMEAGGDRLDYGAALVNLRNYVGELKTEAQRMSTAEFKRHPIRSAVKVAWESAKLSKALKAAWDNSALYRPGNKIMMTSPKIWAKRAGQSFKNIWNTYGGKNTLDALDADILSRENALNGNYKKAKLDVGVIEEAYPTDAPERAMGFLGKKIEQTGVPIVSKVVGRAVGRTYKASQDSYTAFLRGTRADVFDKYIDIAKKTGVELDDTQLQAIGRMVNSLTGRGRLGSLEKAGEVTNVAFFSPKMLKSHVDVFLEPLSGGGGGFTGFKGSEQGTNFVRKQAALNLVKIIGGTAAILTIAKAINDDSVDFDPRSANFGKIKVGNTRFDVTGGWSSIAVLASRLASMKTKSSTTGEIRAINERDEEGSIKYKSQTAKDLVDDFFENKKSPAFSVLSDIMKGETRNKERPTVATTLRDLYEPMPLSNAREMMKDPKSAPLLIAMIADGLGVGTNTYGPTPEQEKSFQGRQKSVRVTELTEQMRQGKPVDLSRAVAREEITTADKEKIEKESKQSSQQVKFENAAPEKALDDYEKMTTAQREEVKPVMAKKARTLVESSSLTPTQRAQFRQRLVNLGFLPGMTRPARPEAPTRPERPNPYAWSAP